MRNRELVDSDAGTDLFYPTDCKRFIAQHVLFLDKVNGSVMISYPGCVTIGEGVYALEFADDSNRIIRHDRCPLVDNNC